MLFFQVLLLGGYTYAHLIGSRLKLRSQGLFQCAVVLSSILLLVRLAVSWNSPITPGASWKPHGADHPVIQIVSLLSICVGLPYFVLSTTGPLVQVWDWKTQRGESTYRLYALSNLGSFLSLLAFPAILEPRLTLHSQAWLWCLLYFVFAISSIYIALRVVGSNQANDASQEIVSSERGARPGKWSYLLWVGLSACASILFLATTNEICQDIGTIPLLWILPLGIYLVSFVICFGCEHWYLRNWFHFALGIAMWAACFVLYDGAARSIVGQIAIYTSVLFVFCMVCNGELARSKPQARFLTFFYLTVAAGGALGGIFVAIVAPYVFKGFWEYQAALWLTAFLLFIVLIREQDSWLYQSKLGSPVVVIAMAALLPESAVKTITRSNKLGSHLSVFVALALVVYVFSNRNRVGSARARRKAAPVYCAAALILAAIVLGGTAFAHIANSMETSRNFYGVSSVVSQNMDDPANAAYCLRHGRVVHGCQFRAELERKSPTTYYSTASGIGIAFNHADSAALPIHRNLRIGVVGLGVGTIAAYGQPGDTLRFYEINPDVIRLASDRRYFSFLSDSSARIDLIPGDGRLSLERELDRQERQDFDILVIDAFSGDAIPVHLLTLQAFEIYIRQLKNPSGILCIHITNSYLDLKPVVFSAAGRLGLKAVWLHSVGDGRASNDSDWMLLSRKDVLQESNTTMRTSAQTIRPWTDDYSNLFQILNR